MAARPNQGPNPDAANHYELLGIKYTATPAEVTRAYRAAMKRFHPDRVGPEHRQAAEHLSKEINRAYATLSNPTRRVAYDRSIRQQESQDLIMRRYTGGFAGPPATGDPYGASLKRDISAAERRDHRRSERSAIASLFAVFVIVTLVLIGLILMFSVISFVVREFV